MTNTPPNSPAPPSNPDRFKREAAALRENLKRRKAQQRARQTSPTPSAPPKRLDSDTTTR
jgi:hypothetical protein